MAERDLFFTKLKPHIQAFLAASTGIHFSRSL